MLAELLSNISQSLSQTCPFPIRIGEVIPRLEMKYPIVALSYAGTTEINDFPWHKIRISCYVRVNYSKIEDGEVQILKFVDWILNNRIAVVLTDNSHNTMRINCDTYASRNYIDDNSFVILEASFIAIAPSLR